MSVIKSGKFICSLFLFVLAAAAVPAARADSLTYDFTYTGVGVGTAKGGGWFTYDSTTQDVTGFYFSDTFYNLIGKPTASFTYSDPKDITYQGMLLFADGTLAGIDITTTYLDATSGSGQADFSFNYAIGAALDATTGTKLGENTIGSGSVTLANDVPGAAVTPEPSSLMLLGTGILGVAGVARKKFFA